MSTRFSAFAFVAAAFIAGCGGGGSSDEGGSPPPQPPHAGLTLAEIFFDNGFFHGIAFSGDTYNVSLAIRTVFLGGVIEVQVPIHWSNSAGGAGDIAPGGVNCSPAPAEICQALAWFAEIPLQVGTNNIVITATVPGGPTDSVSVTVVRQ